MPVHSPVPLTFSASLSGLSISETSTTGHPEQLLESSFKLYARIKFNLVFR
jgi:hypothetical protein